MSTGHPGRQSSKSKVAGRENVQDAQGVSLENSINHQEGIVYGNYHRWRWGGGIATQRIRRDSTKQERMAHTGLIPTTQTGPFHSPGGAAQSTTRLLP